MPTVPWSAGHGNCIGGHCQCHRTTLPYAPAAPSDMAGLTWQKRLEIHGSDYGFNGTHRGGQWSGEDCTVLCDDCSGNGRCLLGGPEAGRCMCLAGWTGKHCTQKCPQCNTGKCVAVAGNAEATEAECQCIVAHLGGPRCNTPCPATTRGGLCNGHGYCRNGVDTKRDAMLTRVQFTSPPCVARLSRRFWNKFNSHDGSQYSNCDDTSATSCACEYGWGGAKCDIPCPGTPYPCTHRERGRCGGDGKCVCGAGYQGTSCEQCRTDEACNHGKCVDGKCVCDAPWVGEQCNECLYHFDRHKQCRDCQMGWYGAKCNQKCACDITQGVCSGGIRGTGRCIRCKAPFFGPECHGQCNGTTWDPRHTFDETTGSPVGAWAACHTHGTCRGGGKLQNETGAGQCTCTDPLTYAQPDCRECPGGKGNVCSLHGTCTYGAKCACSVGWWGPTCGNRCPGFDGLSADTVCGGRGMCNRRGACKCIGGSWGALCENKCPTDAASGKPCAGNGDCSSSGTCVCRKGWGGVYCTVKLNSIS